MAILLGWVVTYTSFIFIPIVFLSLIIRVIFGMIINLTTDITISKIIEKKPSPQNILQLLKHYKYFMIFDSITIGIGWVVSITLIPVSLLLSIFARTIYGILATYILLRYIPTSYNNFKAKNLSNYK